MLSNPQGKILKKYSLMRICFKKYFWQTSNRKTITSYMRPGKSAKRNSLKSEYFLEWYFRKLTSEPYFYLSKWHIMFFSKMTKCWFWCKFRFAWNLWEQIRYILHIICSTSGGWSKLTKVGFLILQVKESIVEEKSCKE